MTGSRRLGRSPPQASGGGLGLALIPRRFGRENQRKWLGRRGGWLVAGADEEEEEREDDERATFVVNCRRPD